MNRQFSKLIASFSAFLALFALPLCLAGCNKDAKKEGPTIARFDGTGISAADFTAKLKSLPKELQRVVLRHRKDFVEDMVDEHYLEKEAKKRNLQNQPDVRDLLEQANRKIVIAKLIELEVDKKVSLEAGEAEKYYETHKEQFMTPLLYRASHILVATQGEADQIRMQLSGGADFSKLARERSIDSTASRGGDLGFFQKGQLIPEFEEAAFKMQVGETSPVFHTQFGYHIIQLTDKAEPRLRDFSSVKSLVERQLVNEKRSKRYKEFTEKLKAGSKIEIDEKQLEALFPPPAAASK